MSNLVEVYRGETDTIEELYSPYPDSLCYSCLTYVDSQTIVGVGGYDGAGVGSNSVNLLDLISETWSTSAIPNMNKPRLNSYCTMINGWCIFDSISNYS